MAVVNDVNWPGALCKAVLARLDGNATTDPLPWDKQHRNIPVVSKKIDPHLSKVTPEQLREIAEAYLSKLEPDASKERIETFKKAVCTYKRGGETRLWHKRERQKAKLSKATAEENVVLSEKVGDFAVQLKYAQNALRHEMQSRSRDAKMKRAFALNRNRTAPYPQVASKSTQTTEE